MATALLRAPFLAQLMGETLLYQSHTKAEDEGCGFALKFLSLGEVMNRYHMWELACSLEQVKELHCLMEKMCREGARDELIPENLLPDIKSRLDKCNHRCSLVGLLSATSRLDTKIKFGIESALITFDELRVQLDELVTDITRDLVERTFIFIEPPKAHVLEKALKSWKPVMSVFASAKKDIEDAIDSYAVGLNTACVFHLMRVAECGLRALARNLKVVLPRKKKLEWAEWNDILREIGAKAEAIANKRAGRSRDEKLEFVRGASGEFYGFKDAYRNHVMHSRGNYDEFQAARVLSQVEHFMVRLAAKINENGHTISTK